MPDPQLAAELATFLAHQPTAVARLLAEHIDDGTGHCRVCSAGAQGGRQVWPCRIHGHALNASRQLRQLRPRR